MIRSDCGVCGVIDLNDLLDGADRRCNEGSPLAQLDLVALRLSRPKAAAHSAGVRLRLADGPAVQEDRRTNRRHGIQRPTANSRPGLQTARREADLERLVDELSFEAQRLDEDLELLLTSIAAV